MFFDCDLYNRDETASGSYKVVGSTTVPALVCAQFCMLQLLHRHIKTHS